MSPSLKTVGFLKLNLMLSTLFLWELKYKLSNPPHLELLEGPGHRERSSSRNKLSGLQHFPLSGISSLFPRAVWKHKYLAVALGL